MQEGHIWIEKEITDATVDLVKQRIEAYASAAKLVVHIATPGGNVYAGYKIGNYLKLTGKPIKTIVEGEAQSMGTYISSIADAGEAEIRNPSVYMIHEPSQEIAGDADFLESGASELRNIRSDMADAYVARTGLPKEQILAMMKKTTSLNAQQALELGFVDRIVQPSRMAVAIGNQITKMKTEAFKKLATMFAEAATMFAGAVAANVDLADGKILVVEGEGELVGKPATIDGAQAPDKVYPTKEGGSITVSGGVVTEVAPAAAAPAPTPAPTPAPAAPGAAAPDAAATAAAIKALQDEVTALKAAAATANAAVAAATAAQAKAEATATAAVAKADAQMKAGAKMIADIKAEFDKLPTGDQTPPGPAMKGLTIETPVSADADVKYANMAKAMKEEIGF